MENIRILTSLEHMENIHVLTSIQHLVALIEIYGSDLHFDENGKLHSDVGPAAIFNGNQYYLCHGVLHRDDFPAVIASDGSEYYYQNNKLHRDFGPAIILADGSHWYYCNGKIHKSIGYAAYIRLDNYISVQFWTHGELISEEIHYLDRSQKLSSRKPINWKIEGF